MQELFPNVLFLASLIYLSHHTVLFTAIKRKNNLTWVGIGNLCRSAVSYVHTYLVRTCTEFVLQKGLLNCSVVNDQ